MTIDVLQIPALSIRPPWAQLILGGWKPCENRTWTTDYRGPVIIHAGQRYDTPPPDIAKDLAAAGITPQSPRGYLGVVDLTEIHPASECTGLCGVWGEDGDVMFHWMTLQPKRFAEPIPGSGRLGLYRKGIPAEVHAAVSIAMAA
jgi:hypothetical protein